MWQYEKKLQFPINIKTTNTKLANFIISQYGGPDRNCYNLKPPKMVSNHTMTKKLLTPLDFASADLYNIIKLIFKKKGA
ncbi:MAG TPA: hypothetical protein DD391_04935 [Clostridiales bacterium]|nr:hypothetical protein [Clostridiales bacterium]HBL81932.1 hypothetical protein [Clostridiales bacterium]